MKRLKLFFLGFLIPLLSVFIFFSVSEAFDASRRYGTWHLGPGMMGSWSMGGFGMILMMAFWVLLIVALIFLVRWLLASNKDEKLDNLSAVEILKQRYAKGEIDKTEFESIKRTLVD